MRFIRVSKSAMDGIAQCPMCGGSFPQSQLMGHANECLDTMESSPPQATYVPPSPKRPREELIACPICTKEFSPSEIERHAARCDGTGASGGASGGPTFSCPLCNKSGQPLDICFRMDECGHPFCRTCITKFANDQIFVAMTLTCPTPGCKAAFSIRDTEMLLPELTKAKSARQRHAVASTKLNPTRRLMDELRYLQSGDIKKNGFAVEPVDDDLFKWHAYFFGFDKKDEQIARDLDKVKGNKITLLITFPKDYPLRPPSVRVLRPRLQHMTGHVTIGGSVCFEMLTSQGWQPQFNVESLLVSIRTNLVVGNARVDFNNKTDYTEAEANDAFDRMLRVHGWQND